MKKNKKAKVVKKKVKTSQWPKKTNLFFRPDRISYVRKLHKMDGCVFCEALKKGNSFESLCVFRDQHAMVILNKYPYNTGHLLVLPVDHCGDVSQLSEDTFFGVQSLLRRAVKIVQNEYKCSGINIGMNMGHVAGAGIPEHMHWHVIPRWMGDTNFFPLIADTKVLPETLQQTYERYRKHFL